MSQTLTITLSSELAQKIRVQATAHGYASETQYVEDQMAEAVVTDPEFEGWLSTVGVQRYDTYHCES